MLSPAKTMYVFCIPDASPGAVPAAVIEAPPLPNRDAENAKAQRFAFKRGKAASSRPSFTLPSAMLRASRVNRTPYTGAGGRNAASVKPRTNPTQLSSSCRPQTLHHQSVAHSLKIWIFANPFESVLCALFRKNRGVRGASAAISSCFTLPFRFLRPSCFDFQLSTFNLIPPTRSFVLRPSLPFGPRLSTFDIRLAFHAGRPPVGALAYSEARGTT